MKSSAGTSGESMFFDKIGLSPRARSTLFWHPVFCKVFRNIELVSQEGSGVSRGCLGTFLVSLGASRGVRGSRLGGSESVNKF